MTATGICEPGLSCTDALTIGIVPITGTIPKWRAVNCAVECTGSTVQVWGAAPSRAAAASADSANVTSERLTQHPSPKHEARPLAD
jgi:hypothetical protein